MIGLLCSLCGSAADSSIIISSMGRVNQIEGFGLRILLIWKAKLLLFWRESDIIDRRLYSYKPLGHRQAVRHSTLTAAFEGSNPAGPAEKRTGHVWLRNMSCSFLWNRRKSVLGFSIFMICTTKNTRANALVFSRFDS